jgi:hypothetical protein
MRAFFTWLSSDKRRLGALAATLLACVAAVVVVQRGAAEAKRRALVDAARSEWFQRRFGTANLAPPEATPRSRDGVALSESEVRVRAYFPELLAPENPAKVKPVRPRKSVDTTEL